ncbi:MAG: hypothetical protein ACQEQE_10510 [Bacillota bacterium]
MQFKNNKVKTIVIDLDLILDKNLLIQELRSLRISNNNLKFIILASNLSAGDKLLKEIVQLGIYNIILSQKEKKILSKFQTILKSSLTYQEVSFLDYRKTQTSDLKNPSYIHHLGSKVISGLSFHRGIGLTHFLIMLSNYLSIKHSVAFIEMNNSQDILDFGKSSNVLIKENKFSHNSIDYYFNVDLYNFFNNEKHNYEFIILDFGYYKDILDFKKFLIGDLKCCVCSGIDWKVNKTLNIYNSLNKKDPKNLWIYLVPFINKKYLKDLTSKISNPVYTIPFNVNPFILEKDTKKFFKKFMQKSDNKNIFKKIIQEVKDGIW